MLRFNEYRRKIALMEDLFCEARFGRLLKHITDSGKVVLFISAELYTLNRTPEEVDRQTKNLNKERTKKLRNELKQLVGLSELGSMSFFEVRGGYVNNGITYSSEVSFAVIGDKNMLPKLEKIGRELGKKFNQESYLIVHDGKGYMVYLKDVDDGRGGIKQKGTRDVLGSVTVNDIKAKYFTKFKNGKFSFVDISEEQTYIVKKPTYTNIINERFNNAFMEIDDFYSKYDSALDWMGEYMKKHEVKEIL